MYTQVFSPFNRAITECQRQYPKNQTKSNSAFAAKDNYGAGERTQGNDQFLIRQSLPLGVIVHRDNAQHDRETEKDYLGEPDACHLFNHLLARNLLISPVSLPRFFMNLAGTPPTTVPGGTDRVTTAPAPTMLDSPISIPSRMVTLAPIYAPRRIVTDD